MPNEMFAEPKRDRGLPVTAIAIAGVAVALLVAVLLLLNHHGPAAPAGEQPLAAYAPNLVLSQVTMSQSGSLSGASYTYIDGVVTNTGKATVTAATVQVFFANDEALAPQIQTLPLALIRTHEPYIDIEPISAAPLVPGGTHEFRLIFDTVAANWNQSLPAIHIVGVSTR